MDEPALCACGHPGRPDHDNPADEWGSACLTDGCRCVRFRALLLGHPPDPVVR